MQDGLEGIAAVVQDDSGQADVAGWKWLILGVVRAGLKGKSPAGVAGDF
jgi:hypothetical protein